MHFKKETPVNAYKSRIFLALICLTLALAQTIGSGQASPSLQSETDFAAIDAYVTEQVNNLGIPGLALGIVQDGQIAHLQGFGVADSSGRAVTPQTPFYLGSVTKPFTALAVMQLVEAGQIDLDEPVQTYLPWFELADKEASAKITVRHLLNQTSGMSTRDGNLFWTDQQGMEAAVRGLDNIQLTQPVGATWQYNNFNYIISGLIVEVVSGQSYADYVTEYIFEPLEMRHSYASRELALADGLSEGHMFMFGRGFRDERVRSPAALPTGFLIASAEDLTHFALAQLDDGRYGESEILSPQGIAAMHAPAVPKGNSYWGIGWDVNTWEGLPVVSRVGDNGNFHATLILLPESDQGTVLLANASGFEHRISEVVDRIAVGVLNLLNGKPAAPVSVPFIMHFLYWAVLLTPLLQILGIVFVWRRRHRLKTWGVILTVVLNLAVVFFILSLSQNEMPLRSLLVFHPELGYEAVAVTALGLGWSVSLTAMFLMRRRSQPAFARAFPRVNPFRQPRRPGE
jgi:CubicO group peptidase (beta-lactamase class C family)